MKTRFTTLDICAALTEINSKLVGMRLANVYDLNNKTYLLKLAKPDSKAMLLMESGIRFHISEFDWPKNMMPSGFSMKLRKHLKGRRLVSAKQLGIDRIIDMQFGSEEAAFHIILELYDRGNIILTDHQYKILNILRFRRDKALAASKGDATPDENSDVRFAVNEIYPLHTAKQRQDFAEIKDKLCEMLQGAKNDDVLKRILNPHLPYGSACIEHCLLMSEFPSGAKIGKDFSVGEDSEKLFNGLQKGEYILDSLVEGMSGGYIIQKSEKKPDGSCVGTNVEFHPFLFKQHEKCPHAEFDSFNKAVDEFFGSLESQKADLKILQQEKSAHKKLDNIRKDHEQRLANLEKEQTADIHKAQLIEENLSLVEQAIRVVRTAIANQIDWGEISSLIKDAQAHGDPVALLISKLNLQSNEFTMALYEAGEDFEGDDNSEEDIDHRVSKSKKPKPVKVNIDLGLSAYGNAKKYYNRKRQASQKQQKIVDASEKALKSAEKKTTQSLKEAAVIHNIQKARKTFWFEKFIWFISSENYLVIGGRDAQQNEILVKKYLTGGDVYVHADLHGATSCVIKNPTSSEIPPKTLNEAGTMAICHSAAWTAKVVTSAWWVHSHQVSKTAPSGEYLTTGSFLIRGKKNYLPPSYLVYGFGILFKVDETCIHKHKDERKVIVPDANQELVSATEESLSNDLENELEIGSDSEGDDSDLDSKDADSMILDEGTPKHPYDSSAYSEDLVDENMMLDNARLTDDFKSSRIKFTSNCNQVSDPTNVSDNKSNHISLSHAKNTFPEDGTQHEFPDTNVKIKYESFSTMSEELGDDEEEPHVVYLGDDEPVVVRKRNVNKSNQSSKQRKKPAKFNDTKEEKLHDSSSWSAAAFENDNRKPGMKSMDDNESVKAATPPKRGQRNRIKKIKNKYRDQDEEERAFIMKILQESQSQKARDRKAKKIKAAAQRENQRGKRDQRSNKPRVNPTPKPQEEEADSDEERTKVLQNEHLLEESAGILNSLTGSPLPDDILLFALPVCAPYNTMHNYKFKVKLTPGNTKKGKGAKTALNLFQNLRETTAQEKDHLRSIKDHDLARNIPGKVKVSSTHLQLQRKKK